MGFFKKLFKKKKGGTFFGNLLRGASSAATGGILGSGAALANFEAKEAEKEQNALIQQQMQRSEAFKMGSNLGKPFAPAVQAAVNSPEAEKAKKGMMLDYLKKNWWKFVIPAVVVIAGIIYLVKKKGKLV